MTPEQIIAELDKFQVRLFVKRNGMVEPADPVTLSNNLLLIRGLLIQLVDVVADAELAHKKAKASRFDKFIKEGVKKSPAFDLLKMEPDLIEMEIETERVRNYMRYVDGLCTSIQSVLKVQAGADKNQY
jgi:hypothetical protein